MLLPHNSGMPIDVDGVLICSGGTGFGVMDLSYRQRSKPRECLGDHQDTQHTRQPGHQPNLLCVFFAYSLIAVPASTSQPSLSLSASASACGESCL